MERWDYRTIRMNLESWTRMNETYEDFVITYADGLRLEGIEMVLRRYLDDGGWDLVSIVPTSFSHRGANMDASELTLIFRRKIIPS